MAGEVSFVSLGVADVPRARAFYGALLGWTFERATPSSGSVISGAGVDGGIHGGDSGASPYVFFAVDDLERATARVRELGGAVEPDMHGGEPDPREVARFGRFRLCRDDQGSGFGLHEPPAT